MSRHVSWAASMVGVVATLLVSTSALGAFPGERGQIVFVSGQGGPAGDDSGADVYVVDQPGGVVTPLDTRPGQHRHPNWSPDLRKVAYALWEGANNEKIWVQDLTAGTTDRLGPHAGSVRDDRPAFSHDGKKIAYESEVADGSGQMDILIKDISGGITGGTVLNLTESPGVTEGKPVWSLDDKWIYYSRRPAAGGDDGIYRRRSDGSGDPLVVIDSATAEYQTALSPDGRRMCYTRGPFGSPDAQVYVLNFLQGGIGVNLSDTGVGAYNCAWSPDGKFVTYVRGIYANGALVYERADNTGTAMLVTADTANHFDGNPDWAPLRPAFCAGKPITIAGTGRADTLRGTRRRNVIAAFGGNDVVKAGGGRDLVCGGKGNDRLFGGAGGDDLRGEQGKDRLYGEAGFDRCVGGPGRDTLRACERRR